jgi:hypothetical protein
MTPDLFSLLVGAKTSAWGWRFTKVALHFIVSRADSPVRATAFLEGWLSLVEGTRLEIERGVKPTVGSNPTPSAILCDGRDAPLGRPLRASTPSPKY